VRPEERHDLYVLIIGLVLTIALGAAAARWIP
jgi:hypothetical protein